ncbi:tRNA glutamyl-Q(34) synthetase GluQRS [Salinivibrio sp. IB643]|jgi:glutamyl-queuosine tRNA(Asp) synthetase|uniref:tRNA glutamyl-Q(34) synthetase GluQRS n=1 Tax=Salinivibrio TaxID=51366 RepID=UPI00098968F1|nr:tRNA glutamyl-Q(34) synthetase GluQRS [Salinivibrio sp. IB643]OOF00431.1 tRNA glutamyl-Q(34) synthetase GluQRS [Salinivibrio sp. IB643]
MTSHAAYIGRFAPSPSGPLHFGSLVAALGSYLDARAHHGRWLVRIEDIDPPREKPGAASDILRTLEAYGLHWDGPVRYQSQHLGDYQAQIDAWLASGRAYYCTCTRRQIKQAGGVYPGWCRDKNKAAEHAAVRLKSPVEVLAFNDRLHGSLPLDQQLANEDFIIKRRDGLYAYNLAVVLDDIDQGVTDIVRGADLIIPTGRHIGLYRLLGARLPHYLHLPLALNAEGQKLSKQNRAPAIDNQAPLPALRAAMRFLGLHAVAEEKVATPTELLNLAVNTWSLTHLPKQTEVTTAF